ncbi:hypothetical protein EMVG_00018 [Emiliania huxleyi virus PS401]|nr:hypothetical protein EMVG_00018 [Emiliania huxleyi virus PS401]
MTGLVRKKTWRPDLAEYVAAAARQPFRPGRHDCALFAAGAVKAMTGADFARGYRSTYRSLAKGRQVLQEKGFADHVALAAHHLPEIAPIMAQEGDIAVVAGDADSALGVVQGPMIYVLRPGGLGLEPLTAAVRAFRV